jgi:shikimate dehydrogenase
LKHSYSPAIHGLIAADAYEYGLKELKPEQLGAFVQSAEYDGFNVTIPYKKDVMKYLSALDKSAELCGAVNTVVRRGERLIGFNTDFDGFKYLLKDNGIAVRDKRAVILGTGGTSATVIAVLTALGARSITTVSRSGNVDYGNYAAHCADADILVNTSPVGMYPKNGECLVDLACFENLSAVVDVIYNPLITRLGFAAIMRGIKYCNGLAMLVAQAKYASDIFLGQSGDDGVIERAKNAIEKETRNIVLVGMPGSGKTSIGRLVAEKLGREFVDTDAEVERQEGIRISEIFEKNGEEYFRAKESSAAENAGKKNGAVISTGGGILLDRENFYRLKQNGLIIYVKRGLNLLASSGRPLSLKCKPEELFAARRHLYEEYSDVCIENDGSLKAAAEKIYSAINK